MKTAETTSFFFLISLAVFLVHGAPYKTYEGYQVLKVYTTDDNVKQLRDFFEQNLFDIWKHPSRVDEAFHVNVDPENLEMVKNKIESLGSTFEIMIFNLGERITGEREEIRRRRKQNRDKKKPKSTTFVDEE